MTALDLLTFTLGGGLLVLVVSTTVIVMGMVTEQRHQRRVRRPAPSALTPSAAQAVALARKRADAAQAELGGVPGVRPTGQIIDVTDGHDPDRDHAVDDAIALALHVAETDPQRIAEVIRAWIRADLSKSAVDWIPADELEWPLA